MRDPLTKEIFWYPPGGKLEGNETPVEAVRREFFEETGSEVKLFSERYKSVEHKASWAGESFLCISYTFVGEPVTENLDFDIRPQKREYELEMKWVGLSELNAHLDFSKELLIPQWIFF